MITVTRKIVTCVYTEREKAMRSDHLHNLISKSCVSSLIKQAPLPKDPLEHKGNAHFMKKSAQC